jgi:lysine-specific demethylase 8
LDYRALGLIMLLFCFVASCIAAKVPIFGIPGLQGHIEVRDTLPTSREFFEKYANGWGKPVVFKGAAAKMRARYALRCSLASLTALFPRSNWTDDYLKANFADIILDTVEMAKKETRTAGQSDMRMGEFLEKYHSEDMYTVSEVVRSMQQDVTMPTFLNCGGYTNYLDSAIMWFSSGGTKSVIHNDGQDNVNCLFSGRKRLAFFHPMYKTAIESKENGWIIAEEDRPDAYGSFSGLDVEGEWCRDSM